MPLVPYVDGVCCLTDADFQRALGIDTDDGSSFFLWQDAVNRHFVRKQSNGINDVIKEVVGGEFQPSHPGSVSKALM